jgi:hypothetical protein
LAPETRGRRRSCGGQGEPEASRRLPPGLRYAAASLAVRRLR